MNVEHEITQLADTRGWSKPSTIDATGVHHGYQQITLHPRDTLFQWLNGEYQPIKQAWLSRILPGGYVLPHRDASPYYERWQIPVEPAGSLEYHDHDPVPEHTHPAEAGVAFRVEHWRWHSVQVPHREGIARLHIVLDRDVSANYSVASFALMGDTA